MVGEAQTRNIAGETETEEDRTEPTYRELLRVRAFRDLWAGQAISQFGDALYYLVFLFMVEKITGDPKMVGVAGMAQTLPFLLLSPYAGVVADRADRRKLMLRADVFSAVVLLLFAVLVWRDHTPPAWTLIATGALLSVVNVFFAPAKSAAIPQIVPPGMLVSANSLSMATQFLMPMLGVAVSGTILAALYALSPAYFFLSAIILNALSFVGSALFVRRLPDLTPDRAPDMQEGESTARKAVRDMREGLAYLRRQRVLWVLLWLNVLVQVAIAPFMLVYVQVNSRWFGGGYGTLALCESAFFVGVVLCSLLVQKLKIRRPGIAFVWGMAGIGMTVMFMAVSRTPAPFAFWNFVAGLAFPFSQIPMTAYVQRTVPEQFQGRVNSAMTMAGWGVQPLSIGLGGLLLSAIGPAWMLAVMGLGMALAALLGLRDHAFRTVTE
jgi:MFS family permease